MKAPRVEDLTLREKIGQTCVFTRSIMPQIGDAEAVRAYFEKNPIGALWFSARVDNDMLLRLLEKAMCGDNVENNWENRHIRGMNGFNKMSKIPVLPIMDATRGIAQRIFPGHTIFPTGASLGATHDPDLGYEYGQALGEDLRSLGFYWLWSPVADNPGRFSDGRAVGCKSEDTTKMLSAIVRGLQDAGVAACVKHFPGHDPLDGRDTHFCTASYSQSKEVWDKTQRLEFQACIDAGVDSVMTRHATFKAVDDTRVNDALLPATFSYKIMTELLKGEMGFNGVIVTDDISMKAATAIYGEEQSFVEALRAGVDMILGPRRLDYIDIVEEAVLSGNLPESRIDDACRRVLAMKEKYGMFSQEEIPALSDERMKEINDRGHALTKAVSEKGISLCANRTNFLPLNKDKIKKVKLVYIGYSQPCYEHLKYAVEEFEAHGAQCDIQEGFAMADNASLPQYDLIIYATFIDAWFPAGGMYFFEDKCKQMRMIMTECAEKSMGVSFGCPDIFYNYFTAAHTFVNAYGFSPEIMRSFVRGIYGEVQFTDYHPFPLNPIYKNDDVYC